jgi:hypothetical protein
MTVQERITADIVRMTVTRKNEQGEVLGYFVLEDVDGVLTVVEEVTYATH